MCQLPKRLRLWLDEYLADALTVVSAIFFALGGLGPSYQWRGWIVILLMLLGGVCAVGAITYNRRNHRPTLMKLSDANAALDGEVRKCRQQIDDRTGNLIDVVNVLLRDLADAHGIYRGDTRLSVYRHSGNKFYLVGRVSPNVEYAAVGRTSYPDNQGFIGQVWLAADDKTIVHFPADRQDWVETQVESYGFSRSEAEALKMQTSAMTATKLWRDLHGDAFGVVCIESDKPRTTVKAATLNEIQQSQHFQTLTSILDICLKDLTHEEVKRGFLERTSAQTALSNE